MSQRKLSRILIVSPIPPPYSGPEVMTQHLLNSSLRNKYHLVHFNISKGRGVSTKARFDMINIIYGLLQPLQLCYLLWRHKPDAVYTNLAQNWGGVLRYASFILPSKLFGVPVIARVMGDGFNHFYQSTNPFAQWLIRVVLKQINSFIVRSDRLKHQFDGLVSQKKLNVVHIGIDTESFDRPVDRSQNLPLRILFVGYLTKAKGALDLLQAVPYVVEEYPDVVFQLMGERVDVERNITYVNNPASNVQVLDSLLADPRISDYVELLGVQSGEQKINSFANADIFVCPSYSESGPIVVLEAMAAGLPVVSTPVGVLPEVFDEDNILFFEPGNILDLSRNILKLATSTDLRNTMGRYNKISVGERFNLEAYAMQVDSVIKKTIKVND